MANRLVSKKGLWIGGLAVAALLVATAIPGLAAPSPEDDRTRDHQSDDGGCQHQRGLPREGDEQLPRRFRVEPELAPGDGSARVHGDRCRSGDASER